jgi:hypothetical protein
MAWEIESEGEDQQGIPTRTLVDTANPDKKITLNKRLVSEKAWDLSGKYGKSGQEQSQEQDKEQKIFSSLLPDIAAKQKKAEAPEAEQDIQPMQPTVAVPQQPVVQQPVASPIMQATTTQTQQTMMGPEYKKALGEFNKATQEVMKTSEEEQKLQLEKQQQIGMERMRINQLYEDDAIEYESMRLMNENKIERQRAKVDEAKQKYDNYQYREFFEGRTGAKVMAGIAMALGAVGSALTKGENTAFKIIQNAIDSDMRMQQAQHDKLKGEFEGAKSLYSELRAQGLDELQAFQVGMNIQYKQGIDKLDAMNAQISDPQAKAKLEALKAQMQQDMAAKMADATRGFDIKAISETKPMVMPSAKEQAQGGREIEEYVNKTPIKEAADAYQGLQEFKNAIAGGATPQAIASFIASNKGLGQGSYGPLFEKMLMEQGLIERTKEGVIQIVTGAKPETLVRSIENFLESKSFEAGVRAQPYLQEFERLNIQAGRPADLYTRQINPRALIQSKERAGGMRELKTP